MGQRKSPSSHFGVPDAVLQEIYSYLDVVDQVNCTSCSRSINRVSSVGWGKKEIRLPIISRSQLRYFLTYTQDITSLNLSKNGGWLIDEDLILKSTKHLNLGRHTDVVEQLRPLKNKEYLKEPDIHGVIDMTRLKHLNLAGCHISDEGLVHLEDLPLQYLNLKGCRLITNNGLQNLKKMPLQYLSLESCYRITGDGLVYLQAPLQHLNLKLCHRITDKGLAHLENIPLQYLNLQGCRLITNSGLQHFYKMPLKYLNLESCYRITGDGLIHLQAPLQHLNLKLCHRITDNGLLYLRNIALQHLNLESCYQITDAGLVHLHGLQYLNLESCYMVTDAGLAYLQSSRPLNLSSHSEANVEMQFLSQLLARL